MKNFNSTYKLPHAGRHASSDVEAFKKALRSWEDVLEELDSKDFSIEFDFENVSCGSFNFDPDAYEISLETIKKIKIGDKEIPYLPVCAGGDGEFPVCFVIYLSKKGVLRAYVPRRGNIFNPLNKSAFGNDDEEDEKFLKSVGLTDDDLYDESKISYDEDAMLEDIAARLIP